jgi:hypothetical protein
MRWSEAGYLSRIVLTHAPRQASVSLILDVRSISNHLIRMQRQTKRYRSPAGAARLAGLARIFAGYRIDWLGLEARPCFPGEQAARPEPTPAKQNEAPRLATHLLRISRFGRGVDAQSAPMTTESRNNNRSPNKAMEPTPVNVTFPASAGNAPFTSAAHLLR